MIRIYQEKSSKVKKEVTFFLITDLHYNSPKDLKKYQMITETLKKDPPEFLCIGGDLLDSAVVKKEEFLIKMIETWSQYSKIIIVPGNHDITIKIKEEEEKQNLEFYQKISSLKNVFCLHNQIFETEEIRIIGVSLPFSYYYKEQETSGSLEQFLNQTFKTCYDNDKMNILLIHSSIGFTKHQDLSKITLLKNIDFVFSGHTHNGCVPKFLEHKMKNRGILSPNKNEWFKDLLRGKFSYQGISFIISGGITKLSKRSKLYLFDHFWPHEITVIKIKSD